MFHRFITTNILCSLAVWSEKAFDYNLFNTIKSESHISGKVTYFTRNEGGWTCSTKCEWIFVTYWGQNVFFTLLMFQLLLGFIWNGPNFIPNKMCSLSCRFMWNMHRFLFYHSGAVGILAGAHGVSFVLGEGVHLEPLGFLCGVN